MFVVRSLTATWNLFRRKAAFGTGGGAALHSGSERGTKRGHAPPQRPR